MGLDSVEWVMELEREFNVTIPDEVAETLRTPRGAADFIARHVDPRLWTREGVEQRVLQLAAETFGKPLSTVRLDSHIVDDLGAD